jgi:zinc transport system substrate-binding protein
MRSRAGVMLATVLIGALGLTGLAACGADSPPESSGRVRIVAGFYPLQYVAEQIGGDRVSVTNLVQPGAEPHDLELGPRQMATVADADLVVYLAAGDKDPHLWLDPHRLASVAAALAVRLARADPAGAAQYESGAAALQSKLGQLDQTYAQALRDCQRREIVVGHAAFGYLADRYQLTQVAITGLSPDTEPTPQHLAQVAAKARDHRATTIFFETLASPKVAQVIAGEVGARTAVLDPIEGLESGSGADYLSVMLANLHTLTPALGCR